MGAAIAALTAMKKKAIVYDDTKHPKFWPPEAWMNSQLSIARHHGGIRFNGVPYEIDELSHDLCRPDVAAARRKAYTEADIAAIRSRKMPIS
jgi:hypothetical protein